ncbi:hypothetical protein HHI36_022869 [Cryptolaemus montrouzieri]|uniref:WASH complex subunit 4 n=1 Tax=Cryptolaemus montrouzieri TaxID=559131 RepID=A0ABD2PG51_9CUCU
MNEFKHERKINSETHKFIGKIQLQQYGFFSDNYNKRLMAFKNKLRHISNVSAVYTEVISVESPYCENLPILYLVSSDNKLLSKMLASLASLCHEMNMIVKEAEELYNKFIFYGGLANQDVHEKATFSFVQKTFENLQQILTIVNRSQHVINLLLLQLNSLVGKGFYTPNNTSNFTESIDHLADLLVCLLTLDNLLNAPLIKQQCSHYLMVVQNLLHDPHKFSFSADRLQFLEKNLLEIQNTLLKGNIFKNVIQFCCSSNVNSPGVSAEFSAYIIQLLTELDDENTTFFTQLWLQLNALVAFQWNLFGEVDKKIGRKLIELNKKIGSCTIAGNKLWYPEEFLLNQIPSFSRYINTQGTSMSRLSQLTTKSQNLQKEIAVLSSQVSLCLMNIEKVTKQNMTNIEVKDIQEATKLLIEAMKLVKKVSELIKWILMIHTDGNVPIAKSTLLALCRLIEVLKCFQLMFNRNLLPLFHIIMLISQHLTYKTLSMILSVRKNLVQDKSYKQRQLDVLSALSVCEQSMKGPNTRERLLIAKLALSASGLSKDTYDEIKYIISRLELFNSLSVLFKKMCDCSFLSHHSETLIPTYFSKLLGTNADISRFYLILSAVDDWTNLFSEETTTVLEGSIKRHFLDPLIQSVETNLRLQTHLHLALPPSDPFTNYQPLNFRKVSPAKSKDIIFNPLSEAEHYLSSMFYNLTTVVLHDWQTYGEMRRLAYLQYKLETVEDNLPMQTIDQGLDVLEIMRNINIFVSKYLYNLNSQLFVEEKSNNKHLNTINIFHVANSIRTHGIGIMNTTVNFTYQFLQKKFLFFSVYV